VSVLTRAVEFSGRAQTTDGGWGYVSAKDGNDFDEGSTTITQVQGLRGCRNAGIPVPREIIDKAIAYIHKCTQPDGGVQYSSKGGGGRPAISAAAIACLFNAGEYDDTHVPRMLDYAEKQLGNITNNGFGHWHYAHYYYAQVMYREGGAEVGNVRAIRSENGWFPRPRRTATALLAAGLHRHRLHHRHEPHHPASSTGAPSRSTSVDTTVCPARILRSTHVAAPRRPRPSSRSARAPTIASSSSCRRVIVGQTAGGRRTADLPVQPRALPARRACRGLAKDAACQHARRKSLDL